jgi:hypothetical protein
MVPNRPSAESNTTLLPALRNLPAQRLAYYGPIARVKRVFLDITTPAGPRFETKFTGTPTEALDP